MSEPPLVPDDCVDESSELMGFCAHEVSVVARETKAWDRIRFRLRSLLTDVGFLLDAVFGGFDGEPAGKASGHSSSPLTASRFDG